MFLKLLEKTLGMPFGWCSVFFIFGYLDDNMAGAVRESILVTFTYLFVTFMISRHVEKLKVKKKPCKRDDVGWPL